MRQHSFRPSLAFIRLAALAAVVAVPLFAPRSAQALVEASMTAANHADPNNGSPWANVGSVNAATGTYLGNGWVLTANHVGAGAFTLAGTTYSYDGRSVRLTNASDGSPTDLLLFHLQGSLPLLPTIHLATSSPLGATVELVGYGYNAGSATSWNSINGF